MFLTKTSAPCHLHHAASGVAKDKTNNNICIILHHMLLLPGRWQRISTGRTEGMKCTPIHYPPPQKKKKKKCHYKDVQSNTLWLNLNKTQEVSILQSADQQGNPHFTFIRRAQNADTHALKQFHLSASVFYWLLHLICILSLKAKNM